MEGEQVVDIPEHPVAQTEPNVPTEPIQSQKTNEELATEHRNKEVLRRIIAEDPEWNLAPVDKLSDICIRVIVKNFEKKPVLKGIPEKYRERVIDAISTDLALPIAAPLIPDESYWQRRAKKRFKLGRVKEHDGSWKQLFFELHLAQTIEDFAPISDIKKDTFKDLMDIVKIAAPFIKRLMLKQLRPMDVPVLASQSDLPPGMQVMATKQKEVHHDGPLDHLDLHSILTTLNELSEFQVYYGVKDCGINFAWAYFGMTLNDALKMSASLKQITSLKKLVIQSSAIDDDKCRLLCNGILSNSTLKVLNISHNKIGDSGARGIAKVLATPGTALTFLDLTNNKIATAGIEAIGKSLAYNTTLECLELRLNQLMDAGGAILFSTLTKNKTLSILNVSGNGLGSKSVSTLCTLLRKNGHTLAHLDLSCNKLGNFAQMGDALPVAPTVTVTTTTATTKEASFGGTHGNIDGDLTGKMIFEAISQNKYITQFDLRMTDLSTEYMVAIQGIVSENGAT